MIYYNIYQNKYGIKCFKNLLQKQSVIDPQKHSDITQYTLLNNTNVYIIKTDYCNTPIPHK